MPVTAYALHVLGHLYPVLDTCDTYSLGLPDPFWTSHLTVLVWWWFDVWGDLGDLSQESERLSTKDYTYSLGCRMGSQVSKCHTPHLTLSPALHSPLCPLLSHSWETPITIIEYFSCPGLMHLLGNDVVLQNLLEQEEAQ